MNYVARLKQLARDAMQRRADFYRPSYDPDCLLRMLPSTPGAAAGAVDPSIEMHRRAGRESEALRLLARHFRARQTPRFLYDPSTLHSHGSGLSDGARHWVALAGEQVRDMIGRGLPVYARVAPRLRAGFPWAGEWCAGEIDVLFKAHPHRFAFAPRLALAVLAGTHSAEEFSALLADWMRFAARDSTLPFISTFVVTQRLIASTCALYFVISATTGPEASREDLCTRLLLVIGQDMAFLIPRIGRSHPNGHLLTDRFAGWFLGTMFPEFCRGRIDLEAAENLWLAELERQTYDDGGSFEHAVPYQGLATEMAAGYLLLQDRNGKAVPLEIRERIRCMLRLQADLAGPDGMAPSIGDGTDDSMLPLDQGSGTTPAAMRELYRRMFAPSIAPLRRDHPANERAFWMLSAYDARPVHDLKATSLGAYPIGGIFVFFDHDEATRCIFRTGPVASKRTFAGHMHADLLSVCLIYKGAPVIVDSGTFSYRWQARKASDGLPGWREYFAGPLAHSGVVVADQDPLGPIVGDFRPGASEATVEHPHILEGAGLSLVEARIASPGSYAGISRGVVHVIGEYFIVYDPNDREVAPTGLAYPLQLHHQARVAAEDGRVLDIAVEGANDISIALSDDLELAETFHGSRNPVRGWVSPRYGQLCAAPQLVLRPTRHDRPAAFALCLNGAAPVKRLVGSWTETSNLAFQVTGSDFRDYLIFNRGPTESLIRQFGIEFKGRLLWLRVRESEPTEVRGVDIALCRAPAWGLELPSTVVRT